MAKPIKGTKGNDVIQAGTSSTAIDGDQGFDTVVFGSDFDNAVIKPQHTGNLDPTGNLKLDVTSADGTFSLKSVEMLHFNAGTASILDDVLYNVQLGTSIRLDGSLDPSALKPSGPDAGSPYSGTGNDPNNYVIVRNEGEGIELGLQVKERSGPSFDPTSVDANGTVHYQVPDGSQIGNPARAFWSFDFSVATGLNGKTTGLGDFTFKLLVDTDVTAATNYLQLTLVPENPLLAGAPGSASDFVWAALGAPLAPVVIGDDGGVPGLVTQNSQNYVFYNSLIDADPVSPGQQSYAPTYGPATFDIQLLAYHGAELIGVNHVVVDVVP